MREACASGSSEAKRLSLDGPQDLPIVRVRCRFEQRSGPSISELVEDTLAAVADEFFFRHTFLVAIATVKTPRFARSATCAILRRAQS